MKYLLFLSASFFAFAVQAQQADSASYQRFYFKTGQLASEGTLRRGKPDGFWRTYYENGQLKSAGRRLQFQLDSVWLFFAATGDTTERIEYRQDKKNGYAYRYQLANDSLMNRPIARELWLENRKHGQALYFHPNGRLREAVNYVEGLRQGEAMLYGPDGQLVALQVYKNDFLVFQERINRRDAAGLRQGAWRSFHPNGKLHTEANYKDDQLNGYLKQYDDRGRLVAQQLYKMGQAEDPQKTDSSRVQKREEFFADGRVRKSGGYLDNKPVGIHRQYDNNGRVVAALSFDLSGQPTAEGIVTDEGQREGTWKNLFSDGKTKSMGNYVNGRREGTWTFLQADGRTEQTGDYKNGRKSGVWRWYYPTGELWREERYDKGKREGQTVEYARDGAVVSQGEYLDDERHGPWVLQVGDHREEGAYAQGLRNGLWRHFYPDGKLSFEGQFADDAPTGKHRYYYPSGKLKELRSYLAGTEDGTWRQYAEDGTVLIEIVYRGGKEIRLDGLSLHAD